MLEQSLPDVPAFTNIYHIMISIVEIINTSGVGRNVFEVESIKQEWH